MTEKLTPEGLVVGLIPEQAQIPAEPVKAPENPPKSGKISAKKPMRGKQQ
jgi:hypothetical protein